MKKLFFILCLTVGSLMANAQHVTVEPHVVVEPHVTPVEHVTPVTEHAVPVEHFTPSHPYSASEEYHPVYNGGVWFALIHNHQTGNTDTVKASSKNELDKMIQDKTVDEDEGRTGAMLLVLVILLFVLGLFFL